MTYEALLKIAQLDPHRADYLALRMAYTRSQSYAPYTRDLEAIERLGQTLRQDNLDAAMDAIQQLLDIWYLDIEAHMAADYVYVRRQDNERSAYHRAFAKGLIHSILASGNGRSVETAYIVTDVREEYVVLRVLGLRHTKQSLRQVGNSWFDVFDTQAANSSATQPIYFNVDLPQRWLNQVN